MLSSNANVYTHIIWITLDKNKSICLWRTRTRVALEVVQADTTNHIVGQETNLTESWWRWYVVAL